jgi:hypothetical protein
MMVEMGEVCLSLQACLEILEKKKFDIDQMCNFPQARRFMRSWMQQHIKRQFHELSDNLDEPGLVKGVTIPAPPGKLQGGWGPQALQ